MKILIIDATHFHITLNFFSAHLVASSLLAKADRTLSVNIQLF